MADVAAGFDPDKFRTAIHFVMNLGLPQATVDRPTFYFRSTKTYPPGTRLDTEGTPLDPRIEAVVTTPTPVQVPCAVEYTADRTDNESLVGTFVDSKATLTILDTDFALVKDAIEVALGQSRFNITFIAPPIGLSTVTVYQVFCFPKNEDRS